MDLDALHGVHSLSCAKNRDGVYWTGLSYQLHDEGDFIDHQHCTERLRVELVAEDVAVKDSDKQMVILQALENASLSQEKLFDLVGGSRGAFNALRDQMLQQRLVVDTRGPHNSRLFSRGPNAETFIAYAA